MGEQMSLDLGAAPDIIEAHDLKVSVAEHRFDPDDYRCITFMRRYLNESPDDARLPSEVFTRGPGGLRLVSLTYPLSINAEVSP